jgi:L-alanine-DL-glutamate epimerase-like enolase superfamily enzyme
MKVTGLQTIVLDNVPEYRGGRKFLFIKLTTDEGIVGLGERVTGGVTNLAPQIALPTTSASSSSSARIRSTSS